jgi:hypothetical protein
LEVSISVKTDSIESEIRGSFVDAVEVSDPKPTRSSRFGPLAYFNACSTPYCAAQGAKNRGAAALMVEGKSFDM